MMTRKDLKNLTDSQLRALSQHVDAEITARAEARHSLSLVRQARDSDPLDDKDIWNVNWDAAHAAQVKFRHNKNLELRIKNVGVHGCVLFAITPRATYRWYTTARKWKKVA